MENIILSLVNKQVYEEHLKECFTYEFNDMLLIVREAYIDTEKGIFTRIISKDEFLTYSMTEEEFLVYAYEKMEKTLPSEINYMDEDMYMITNSIGVFGAIYGFNKKLLSEIAEDLKRSLYIIPCSIHEVIVIPDIGHDREDLKAMVKEGNHTILEEKEILSYSIYFYNNESKTLEVIN